MAYDEDFIITDAAREIEVNAPEEVESEQQEQFMFSFDLPRNVEQSSLRENESGNRKKENSQKSASKDEKVVYQLSEDEKEAEKQPSKASPEIGHNGVKKYSLEDYMEVEQRFATSKPAPKPSREEQPEFEKKTIEKESPARQAPEEEADPFNNPISEDLVKRAAERRMKMKEFNYKFRSNVSKLEEIEKQPAYKRAGIELGNNNPGEEKISRTSLSSGDDDEIRFRSNNSFLHDNVD